MYTLKMGASSAGRDYSLTKKDFIAYKNAGIEYMEFSSNADVYKARFGTDGRKGMVGSRAVQKQGRQHFKPRRKNAS